MAVWRIAAWLSIFWVGFAWGQIYKWMDRQGDIHFTDDPSRIPTEYRSDVEVERAIPLAPLPTPSGDTAAAPPTDAAAPGELPSAPPPRDRLGRGPDYWQQLAQHWAAQLQQHLQERDRLQLLYNYTRHLASYTRDNFDRGKIYADGTRLEKAIAETEAQIKEAETMLHTTLPLEARQLGANPEWLKPPEMTQQ
jgi:Domain of unknown function (DUF4124)